MDANTAYRKSIAAGVAAFTGRLPDPDALTDEEIEAAAAEYQEWLDALNEAAMDEMLCREWEAREHGMALQDFDLATIRSAA